MRAFAPTVRQHLAGIAPAGLLAATEHLSWFYIALVVVTIIPFLVVLTATKSQPTKASAWAVLVVQSIFLVNVFVPHVPAAVALSGYAPGVVTAVAIELPFSVYFLRRSVRDRVVSGAMAALAVGLAALVLVVGLATLYAIAAHA